MIMQTCTNIQETKFKLVWSLIQPQKPPSQTGFHQLEAFPIRTVTQISYVTSFPGSLG
jgi:hypothetical protein